MHLIIIFKYFIKISFKYIISSIKIHLQIFAKLNRSFSIREIFSSNKG